MYCTIFIYNIVCKKTKQTFKTINLNFVYLDDNKLRLNFNLCLMINKQVFYKYFLDNAKKKLYKGIKCYRFKNIM